MAKDTEQQGEVVGNPPQATIAAADARANPSEPETGEITTQQAGDNSALPPKEAPAAAAKRNAQARAAQPTAAAVDYEVEDHAKEVKADEKVRIHMAVPIHRMIHGGKWYAFQKDKVYLVPKSLKAALMKRPGLLKPTL